MSLRSKEVGLKLGPRFGQAFEMASRLHAKQKRKGTQIPYLGHLMGVAAIVIDDGGTEAEAVAALLHDAAEDQGGEKTLAEIRSAFGARVARMVADLSDTFEKPKPPWPARKQRYLKHLESVGPSVLRISMADKLHNARAILLDHAAVGEKVWERFTASRAESIWYYRSLAKVYARRAPGPLATEFSSTAKRLSRL